MFPLAVKQSNISSEIIFDAISKFKHLLTFSTIWELYSSNTTISKISQSCHSHLEAASNYMVDKIWPIQMIDAWGKFPEGLLSGHIAMMGDFEECMLLQGNFTDNQNILRKISGRYCPMHLLLAPNSPNTISANFETRMEADVPLYTIGEELNLLMTQPTLAVCLPSACTRNDFNTLFMPLTFATNGLLTPITSYCQTSGKPEFDFAVYAMMLIVIILLALTTVATGLDILSVQKSSSKWRKSIAAFSIPRNFEQLMSTSSSNMRCLNGLRFGSICWVILGHTWSVLTYSPIWNTFRIQKFLRPWSLMTIINGTFCVDTFFTLAGFLISYHLLNGLDKKDGKSFSPMILYFQRYMRITPMYAFLIGMVAIFQPYLSSGPMWSIIEMNSKYCRRNWWQNLLYINNLVEHNSDVDPTDIPCFGEAWYLGCDMQFFVLSIWLIFLVWKYRRTGIFILVATTLLSMLLPGWIIASKNLMPTSIPMRPPTGKETGNYDLDVYVKPWTRYGPYIAGIWTGFAYYVFRKRAYRVNQLVVLGGWFSSVVVALLVLYGPVRFFNVDIPLGKIESVLYGGMARFAWGAAIGWIIFACLTGNGCAVNKFLSMKMFAPLGRISFGMFLISYELQQMFHAHYPHPISYDVYLLTNLFLAHMMLSIIGGFIITMLVESPFNNLSKLIFLSHSST